MSASSPRSATSRKMVATTASMSSAASRFVPMSAWNPSSKPGLVKSRRCAMRFSSASGAERHRHHCVEILHQGFEAFDLEPNRLPAHEMQHDGAGGSRRRVEGDGEKLEHALLLGEIEADMACRQDPLEMQAGMAASVDIGGRLAAFSMKHHDETHALSQIRDIGKREARILEVSGNDREVLSVESCERKRHRSHHHWARRPCRCSIRSKLEAQWRAGLRPRNSAKRISQARFFRNRAAQLTVPGFAHCTRSVFGKMMRSARLF